jgi:hypothetical protein
MNTSVNDLGSCVADLKIVRARLPNNLEPSVTLLFDSVLERLDQLDAVMKDQSARKALINDGLQLAGRFAEVALVAAKLMDHFRG